MSREPDDRERRLAGMDQASRILERFLQVLLAIVAVAVLAGAVVLIVNMDASSKSQGGRLYVAIGAVVVLGAVDSQFWRLTLRRAPLALGQPPRRYLVRSVPPLLLSLLLLVGLALFLP